jgi:hypothetical protein
MKKILSNIFLLALSLVFITGCQDRSELTAPAPQSPKSGTADFTRFVSIGNSITAGYQSSALFKDAQLYAYGNQIAQIVNTSYAMPLVSDPGLGGQLQVHQLSPNLVLIQQPSSGVPLNLSYPAPYNNLGVPGALVYDVLNAKDSLTCASAKVGQPNPFFDLVLRNSGLHLGSQIQQAMALHPTFVTCWIGNNDVLGYATNGGVLMNNGVAIPITPTDASDFHDYYRQLGDSLDTLAVRGAKIVLANIPDVTTIPFFTTVGPLLAEEVPWTAHSIPGLFYQIHGNTSADPTHMADSSTLANLYVMITLSGQNYTGLLGTPTGKWYRDNHYPALPPGIDTTMPFGFYPTNPWPDALILDASEITVAKNATRSFNSSIGAIAAKFNFGLVDINLVFNTIFLGSVTQGGVMYNGVKFTPFYITGGLFSLDGVHPSSQGQGLIANEFLKVINSNTVLISL